MRCSATSASSPSKTCSIGTSTGGSLAIRNSPSTTSVSFENARIRVLRWALATVLSKVFSSRLLASGDICSRSIASSTRRYQMSRLVSSARRRIAVRYSRAAAVAIARRCLRSKPRSRPAISSDAASRFRSHSHGPGRVSSKSLMSTTRSRRGEAKAPKLERWASPQAWTQKPETGVRARSAAMIAAPPR